MRIVRFLDDANHSSYGALHADGTVTALEGVLFGVLVDTGRTVGVKKFLSPLIPAAILCVGLNYRDHAKELQMSEPSFPVLFMKNPASLANPGDPIVIPRSCASAPEVDYEIELAVVIGKEGKDIPVSSALEHVFGYTIANDVSARLWQKNNGGQWIRAKSFDTFCPMGPAIVTKDEIADVQNLSLSCTLNGELMQDGNTSDMIFTVAQLVSLLSADMTLLQGSVILTGTPKGVGAGRSPQVFLFPGDRLDLSISGLGVLSNYVTDAAGNGK
jgi:2-keto-4-pentenoate hydratase/2-oxohepta-3-ene-1,7-dioic acid hydratase in catechol pathway